MYALFEPKTKWQRVYKWVILVLLAAISISMLIIAVKSLIAHESACQNPVYVQATATVIRDPSQANYYHVYIAYQYQDQFYPKIYYAHERGDPTERYEGKTINVAVNAKDPSQPLVTMVNSAFVIFSLIFAAFSIAMLIQGAALERSSFRNWLKEKVWNKYDTYNSLDCYLIDVAIVAVSFIIVGYIVLRCVFPNA